jgi:hypothetical protein
MSEHTSGILIHRDFSANVPGFLENLGFDKPERQGTVDWETATSWQLDGVAVTCVDGWTVVFNSPDMFGRGELADDAQPPAEGLWTPAVERRLAALSVGSKVFAFLLEGGWGTYGFTWHLDGQRRRLFAYHREKVVFDEGATLGAERPRITEVRLHLIESAILGLVEPLCLAWERLECDFAKYKYRLFRG